MLNSIKIHTAEDFAGMRRAGRLAAELLDYITEFVVPGVTTEKLDELCYAMIIKNNAIPAPLNYQPHKGILPYPKSICTSINHVVCHGIPGPRKLNEGDILNIDVTVILDGYYGDTSRMYFVGKAKTKDIKATKLIEVTYEAMMLGIEQVRPGVNLNEVGKVIQAYAENAGFSVVEDFCGHGIGKVFHAPPSVLHYFQSRGPNKPLNDPDVILQEGMFFTIEPMINVGGYETKTLPRTKDAPFNDWIAVTKDNQLSAQFEHTLGVTKDGFEIFTLSPKGWTKPPYI